MSEVGRPFHLEGVVYLYTGQAIEHNISMKDQARITALIFADEVESPPHQSLFFSC